MESKVIPKYSPFPSETGKGIEFGVLHSREELARRINEKIDTAKRREYNPLVIFLVGEWGEGKTTLYERYLVPESQEKKDFLVISIDGHSFQKYAKEIIEKKIFPEENTDPAYQFLGATFLAIRENLKKDENLQKMIPVVLPGETSYKSLIDFVNKSIKSLKEVCVIGSSIRPFLVFIDEFETFALLVEDKILKELVVEGLMRIIDGKVPHLFDSTTKTSMLHFILSMTPPAYSRILATAGEIQGRLLSRVEELRIYPLNKKERVEFLNALIGYMWKGKIEDFTEIFTLPNLLNPIIQSTIGNTRAIQSAIRKLLERHFSGKDKAPPINWQEVLEFLKTTEIEVSGTRVLLINDVYLAKVYTEIRRREKDEDTSNKIIDTFNFVITTFGPISEDTLQRYLSKDKDAIKYYLSRLNEIFKPTELGQEVGSQRFVYTGHVLEILKYEEFVDYLLSELSDQLSEINAFRNIKDEKGFVTDRQLVEYILDLMLFIGENGDLWLFLPRSEIETKIYLKELLKVVETEDIEMIYTKLENAIENAKVDNTIIENKDIYYMLSPALISVLYFSPELTYFDFIKDKNIRFNIWRQALSRSNANYLVNGLVVVLEKAGIKIQEKYHEYALSDSKSISVATITLGDSTKVDAIFVISTISLSDEELEIAEKIIRDMLRNKGKIPHFIFLVYQENILGSAAEFLQKFKTRYPTIPIELPIISSISKLQLIGLGILLSSECVSITDIYTFLEKLRKKEPELTKIIDLSRLNTMVDIILQKELNISSENLIEELKKEHIILTPIKRVIFEGEKPVDEDLLRSALKYFLSFPEAHKKGVFPKDVLDYTEEKIRRWQFYSRGGGKEGILGHDIEGEKTIRDLAKLLKLNGYLARTKEGKYKIVYITEQERKILEFIKFIKAHEKGGNNEGMSITYLRNYFIEETPTSPVFEIIIDIMSDKGLIKLAKEGNNIFIELQDKNEVVGKIKELTQRIEEIEKNYCEKIKKYGYFCDSKQRGYRAKILKGYFSTAREFLNIAKSYVNKSDDLREVSQAAFFTNLADQLLNLWEKKYKKLLSESSKEYEKTLKKVDALKNKLETKQEELKQILSNYVFQCEDQSCSVSLKHTKDITNLYNLLNEIKEKEYTEEEYKGMLELLWEKIVTTKNKEDKKKKFPFYYERDFGERIHFNYKLYQAYCLTQKFILHYPFDVLTATDISIIEKIDTMLEDLENYPLVNDIDKLIEDISGTVEKVLNLNYRIESIRQTFKEVFKEGNIFEKHLPTIESLKIKPSTEEYTAIDDIREDVNEWKEKIKVEKFEELLEKIRRTLEEIEKHTNEIPLQKERIQNSIDKYLASITGFLEQIEESTTIEINKNCEELREIREDIEELNIEILTPAKIRAIDRELFLLDPDKKLVKLWEILEKYRKELQEISHALDDHKEKIEKVMDKITETLKRDFILPKEDLIGILEEAFEKLNDSEISHQSDTKEPEEKFRTIYIKHEKIREDLENNLKLKKFEEIPPKIRELQEIIESLQGLIRQYLSEKEAEIFIKYIEMKRKYKKIKLKDLLKEVRDKEVLLSLIEKDIIPAYL